VHPSLNHTGHRPWPLPATAWKWRQSWLDLAFIHYPICAEILRPLIPSPLKIQEFNGRAWLGLVPFRMAGVARRCFPDVPYFSSFPELNLRTYVESSDGKPGVWFFSLDADSWAITFGGRKFYGLPYHRAQMLHSVSDDGWHHFNSNRRSSAATFRGRYRPKGNKIPALTNSLEHWLTERYCLYSQKGGRISRVDVHHEPWPLYEADVEIEIATILTAAGFAEIAERPVTHFSPGVHVISFDHQTL
jgi:uncharacterized protein YqjF (DUF2071 family)